MSARVCLDIYDRNLDDGALYRLTMQALEICEESGCELSARAAADVVRRAIASDDRELIDAVQATATELLTRKIH